MGSWVDWFNFKKSHVMKKWLKTVKEWSDWQVACRALRHLGSPTSPQSMWPIHYALPVSVENIRTTISKEKTSRFV